MTARASAALGACALLMAGLAAPAQDPAPPAPRADPKAQGKPAGPGGMEFPDLVAGLERTPGCIGVESARTRSGKSVIFAWFEDKAALLAWYRSEMHQEVMGMMGSATRKDAMKDLPDDGPILVIASLTFSEKPEIEGIPLPVSQISVEMYRPLAGGLSAGGTFAPKGLKVPGARGEAAEDAPGPG